MVRNLVAEVSGVYVVFSQSTVIWRCSCKDHGSAEVVSATTTVMASSAGNARLHGDLVTGFERGDRTSNLNHNPRRLMAKDHRPRHNVGTYATALPAITPRLVKESICGDYDSGVSFLLVNLQIPMLTYERHDEDRVTLCTTLTSLPHIPVCAT